MVTYFIVTTAFLGTLLALADDNSERKYYITLFSLPLVLCGIATGFNL